MKKLLSILAALSLSATAASSVVACGTSSSNDNKDKDQTVISSNGIKVTSDDIMNDWLSQGDFGQIFGDKTTALKNFMNYFAEKFMANADDIAKKIPDAAKGYVDDYTFTNITKDYKNRKANAEYAWNKSIKDAKDDDGKKWESKLFDSLKSKFGEDIYKDGKTVKTSSYKDYHDKYVSDSILNGTSDGTSIFSALTNDIFDWASAPKNSSVTDIIQTLKSSFFGRTPEKNDDIKINFNDNRKTGKNLTGKDRESSWLGQMDNVLSAIKKGGANADSLLGYVVDIYNITGGTDDNSKATIKNPLQISQIKWADKDKIKDKLLKSDNVESISNELIKRMDTTYDVDFGDKADGKREAKVANLLINPDYDYTSLINYVPSDEQDNSSTDKIGGLYSNTQRFVANDYFKTERPVAVSEIIISPTQSGSVDYSEQITNSGYVGTDIKMMDQLYNFIGNFIDNGINDSFTPANTGNTKNEDTSNYWSWDDLLTNSKDWDKNVVSSAHPWESDFQGKVKVNTHSNFLTMDSSSSDYSDLLKYSVYDYLSGGNAGDTNTWNSKSATPLSGETSIDVINQAHTSPTYITPDQIKTEYNLITNFIQGMNRTAASAKMYKIVNPTQGIISFVDSDGIHFVRIEAHDLLSKNSAQNQTPLTSNFKDNGDVVKANYTTANRMKNALADANVKDDAIRISSDYNNAATLSQNVLGIKYDDLNKSFGNKYLQFLANASIPQSQGISSGNKYSFDLSKELNSYAKGDISSDSIEAGSNMTLLAWNFAKLILGKNDTELFDWTVKGPENSTDNSALNTQLSSTNWSDETMNNFQKAYKQYIVDDNLTSYTDDARADKADGKFVSGMEDADEATTNKGWKVNNDIADPLHPNLLWKTATGKDYGAELTAIDGTGYWVPFKGDNTPLKSFVKLSRAYRYQVEMNNFIPNDLALKGDED